MFLFFRVKKFELMGGERKNEEVEKENEREKKTHLDARVPAVLRFDPPHGRVPVRPPPERARPLSNGVHGDRDVVGEREARHLGRERADERLLLFLSFFSFSFRRQPPELGDAREPPGRELPRVGPLDPRNGQEAAVG